MKKQLESLGSFKDKSLNQLEMGKIFGGFAPEETGAGSMLMAVEDGAPYGHSGQVRNHHQSFTSDCRDGAITEWYGVTQTTSGWYNAS